MKHARILPFLLSLAPLTMFAQTIASVAPTSGPTSGGIEVVIRGTGLGLPAGFACIAPCPAKVSFGEVEVTVHQESDTRLAVTAPAHAEGTVNITVKTGDGRIATATRAFTYVATEESRYEALLLPVYLDGTISGNGGSRWKTDFWIRNSGSANVQLAPWACPPAEVCLPVFPLTRNLLPGETLHNLPVEFRAPSSNPSRLLYVARNREHVTTNLRVLDVSREGLNAGTDLPVVPDSQMRSGRIDLLNVPADSRFRQHLRIYDVAGTEARFRVRVYENFAGTSGAPPLVQLEVTASTSDSGPFRTRPAYAEIPSVQAILPAGAPQSLRIEIEPLTAGSRFWSFAAVTNNDTQAVTLITPN